MADDRWRNDDRRDWDRRRNTYDRGDWNLAGDSDRDRDDRDYGRSGQYGQGGGQDYNRNYGAGGGYSSGREYGRSDMGDRYGGGSGGYGRSYGGGRDNDRGYTGFGGYGRDRDRDRDQDRNWWDRTRDEVGSWFGDDDAERRRRMDEQRGEHRGRGPEGYTRSDDRIREDVHDRLTDDPHLDASRISVTVDGGEVTLNGTVGSRRDKRHAEDLIERCSGVKHVQNNLRVQEGGGSNMESAGTLGAGGTTGSTTQSTTRSTT